MAAARGESRAAAIRRLLEDALPAETGVDVVQIRRALALSPAERIRAMARAAAGVEALRGRASR